MKKVYCLPIQIDYMTYKVVDEDEDTVYMGDYHDCCQFIDQYDERGMVYYYEDVKER